MSNNLQSIRAYWNERIHDIKLGEGKPGSKAFYEALDEYRLAKSSYLTTVVDFAAWSGRDVLEIGCGAGLDLMRFAHGGARVTGVEVSDTALRLARDYFDISEHAARLMLADGSCLPLASNSFDLVYCHGVLPFCESPEAVVRESERVLRLGGSAIFMVYNRRSWVNAMVAFGMSLGHDDAPGFKMHTKKELERLMEPFPDFTIVGERLPGRTAVHKGFKSAVFNALVVPVTAALPDRWLRAVGWHLLAFCRKSEEA